VYRPVPPPAVSPIEGGWGGDTLGPVSPIEIRCPCDLSSTDDHSLAQPFHRGVVDTGQIDGEGGARSGRTVHRNGTPMVGDDAMDDGNAQTRAFTDRFRGEEGLKNVLQRLARHPMAGVLDGQAGVGTRRQWGMRGGPSRRDLHPLEACLQHPPVSRTACSALVHRFIST
jgi:hypothetical protein